MLSLPGDRRLLPSRSTDSNTSARATVAKVYASCTKISESTRQTPLRMPRLSAGAEFQYSEYCIPLAQGFKKGPNSTKHLFIFCANSHRRSPSRSRGIDFAASRVRGQLNAVSACCGSFAPVVIMCVITGALLAPILRPGLKACRLVGLHGLYPAAERAFAENHRHWLWCCLHIGHHNQLLKVCSKTLRYCSRRLRKETDEIVITTQAKKAKSQCCKQNVGQCTNIRTDVDVINTAQLTQHQSLRLCSNLIGASLPLWSACLAVLCCRNRL